MPPTRLCGSRTARDRRRPDARPGQAALFREQIRYTVEKHFRKQSRLRAEGIKVLSLFSLIASRTSSAIRRWTRLRIPWTGFIRESSGSYSMRRSKV
jgi:hypothetical protein